MRDKTKRKERIIAVLILVAAIVIVFLINLFLPEGFLGRFITPFNIVLVTVLSVAIMKVRSKLRNRRKF